MTYQEAWVDRGGHRIYAREYPGQEPAIVPVVVHDAAGPPGIDWALEHPDRVAGLVLLNTYYCHMPGLRSPEAIWLFSTPLIRKSTVSGQAAASRRSAAEPGSGCGGARRRAPG
jgi:pimeloyl-ACP methyl ester carboxylesterase